MKKIILSSAAAILAVVGFSAFKTAKSAGHTYYWFTPTVDDLPAGGAIAANNSNVTPLDKILTTVAFKNTDVCEGSGNQCALGFLPSEIVKTTSGSYILATSTSKPTITPAIEPTTTGFVQD